MITVCTCHLAAADNDVHRWLVKGAFVDILAFLCELVLNRQPGTEMVIHSQQMYDFDEGVVLHFGCNWGPEDMDNAIHEHNAIRTEIRTSLIYYGTTNHPTYARLPMTPPYGD